MFLSDLSIRRPVVASVMMLTLVTLGLFSLRRLPIDMMPEVEIPVLSIVTQFPGASPETVEREVSKRIEEAINPISGVKHVVSVSREGLSSVIVEFATCRRACRSRSSRSSTSTPCRSCRSPSAPRRSRRAS
jgi:HAE1 family hydrophobic/amphiphilic exporter-1